jgi:predicted helicase
MLLPYYIATLNIEHAYYERVGRYAPFDGICFIDTLDMDNAQTSMFSLENTRRVRREQDADIMIIIGNPPYNMGQVNENDNNKNRDYTQVNQRVRETYAKDSQASNRNALSDMYVKFFRWATDRLNEQDGIICFVSNNGFLDGIAFDGFRKHLAEDFTHIYHLNLGGNARRGKGGNVFDIRVGVGITLLVRKASHTTRQLYYYHVPKEWHKQDKLAFLETAGDISGVSWDVLQPTPTYAWLTDGLQADFANFLPMGTREAKGDTTIQTVLFQRYSQGVKTNRDAWAYNFRRKTLTTNIQRLVSTYNGEVDRWKREHQESTRVDNFVKYHDQEIKWSRDLKLDMQRGHYATFTDDKVRYSLYRPFCKQYLFFDRVLNEEVYVVPSIFPTPATETENVVICVSSIGHRAPFTVLVANIIPNLTINAMDGFQCFPFYTYDEDGSNRRENITDWALAQFVSCYGDRVGKWDIFWYTYALLHHPTYRERYAENLRMELPRIPLLGDSETFHTLASLGKQLGDLHLHYEQIDEYPLQWVETPNVPWTWRVERMHLTNDQRSVVVNDALTLAGVPETCFAYRLGNRSALEWVIDQYRVKTDSRSGITSDPNRHDDQEYITRLVGRVVQVSVQTVALVERVGAIALTPGK